MFGRSGGSVASSHSTGVVALDGVSLQSEFDAAIRRIAELTVERDEYAQQNAELFVLQQVFSAINSTLDIDDILSMVLRGIREALRFNRVILFDVENGEPKRRLETDASGSIVASRDPAAFRPGPVFDAMIGGTSDFALGTAAEDDAPIEDVRSTFCMLPLISRNTVRGLLYVDDPPTAEVNDSQLRMLLDFAAQGAMAIENARLYNETKRLLEETQRLALTDHLTGLANRRALNDLLERELFNAKRYQLTLAFVILDLDDLKRINDSSGHAAGDWALKNFADVLKASARKGDVVARYAGDEFVIVMSQVDREQAEQGIERLFSVLRREGIKCSVGAAMFPYDGADGPGLFFAADEALYEAKQHGKNRFTFFDRTARKAKTVQDSL